MTPVTEVANVGLSPDGQAGPTIARESDRKAPRLHEQRACGRPENCQDGGAREQIPSVTGMIPVLPRPFSIGHRAYLNSTAPTPVAQSLF